MPETDNMKTNLLGRRVLWGDGEAEIIMVWLVDNHPYVAIEAPDGRTFTVPLRSCQLIADEDMTQNTK